MSVHLKPLVLALTVLAATLTVPAAAASAAPGAAICKTKAACADGGLRATSSGGSARTTGDIATNAIPVPTPPAFPPGTPCYREEVSEEVYETATYTTIYELYFQASVCLFPNEIVLYGLDTSLSFPNDVQDPRLTSMQFVVRDQIVNYSPTEKDGYSELWVTFCPDPAQPSACQRYLHRLGLIFNPAWVYPFSVFQRLS
ncbi:hypothetical protein [Micromonospora ureilytica]|uniref:Secreted protein n=1 Tax=Micromonospora ureilytica TaxID=709868 RepID=A0ABS0JD26_9ACTN|nr:hypothetical protein [Micromonospora ureilytica]MBG6064854.1 hypothetical protein [Micromonospora ureilytica]